MTSLTLPLPAGGTENYTLSGTPVERPKSPHRFNRIAFAAAHVVADPMAAHDPWIESAVDWDRTLAFRHHLWDLGLAVAEAMDTSQRGMGLDWLTARELIRRSIAEARTRSDAVVFSGVGTDHLVLTDHVTIDDVVLAYLEQIEAVAAEGGRMIVMASRALAAKARSSDDYASVYGRILGQVSEPVILHWLGDMFDPALAGYWGNDDIDAAMENCLTIIEENAAKIDGIKISLLDKDKEIIMRRRLPEGVRMYTGDDFNYPELIEGDGEHASDALLGIFDSIAPVASAALAALAEGDTNRYRALLAPTVPLARHIFAAQTRFYKTGVVFLAWLNGHQPAFTMVGGQESARSALHFAELFRLADAAGLLDDPAQAADRFGGWLSVHAGIER
ncbi:MAG: dihydrodipicolinate synthase family protein [Pseudomonadota bacterium]